MIDYNKLNIKTLNSGKLAANLKITNGPPVLEHECIPFSSPQVTASLYGGIPFGFITEISGADSGGKTTTCIDITKNAIELFEREYLEEMERLLAIPKPTAAERKRLEYLEEMGPRRAVWYDSENTFDDRWARDVLGCDPSKILFLTHEDDVGAEVIFTRFIELIDSEDVRVGLCIIDSIANLQSTKAADQDVTKSTMGGIAKPLAGFCSKLSSRLRPKKIAFIGVNQLRDQFNSQYPTTDTPGGRGWHHAAALRLICKKGSNFDEKYNEVAKSAPQRSGHIVEVSIRRTKVCSGDKPNTQYYLHYKLGVVPAVELFKAATDAGYILKAAAMFTFCNPNTGVPLVNPEDPKKEYKVRGEATAIEIFCGDRELQELYAAKFNVALPLMYNRHNEEEDLINENEYVGDVQTENVD
jgi:RecA/RadA recombinase